MKREMQEHKEVTVMMMKSEKKVEEKVEGMRVYITTVRTKKQL